MNEIIYNKCVNSVFKITDKYKKSGRFTEEMGQKVTDALKGQDLNIAVIGKMNVGKSSFINALIFHGEVVPSGPAPTTATLTEIVYTDNPSEDSRVTVELLTCKDIKDLQDNAKSEDPQISENANKLLNSLNRITGGYEQYVAMKDPIEIDLDGLPKFTSAEGEFSGLAKKVTIYKHLEVLRGLKITDTPGFNDPVRSRGEATKDALKACHIIFFVHNYLDMYDQGEIAILMEQVKNTGVSVLVDIVNRMDEPLDLTLDQWASCVPKFKERKEQAINQIPEEGEGIKELLTKGIISCVSAKMALIGYEVLEYDQKKPNGNINEDTKVFYEQYQNDFSELKSADDFVKYSHIGDIVNIINQLSEGKNNYLSTYPIQTLVGFLESTGDTIKREIRGIEADLKVLTQNSTEAKQKLSEISEVFEALQSKINGPLLATRLRERISETKSSIRKLRQETSEKEFTDSNYEERGNFFNHRPENRNLTRYKSVLIHFDDEIWIKLKNLRDVFTLVCEAYVNELVQELVTHNTTLQDRNSLAGALIDLYKSAISVGIDISILPDEPTYTLEGDGMQYSLYRSDFLQRRSDVAFDKNYLKPFSDFVKSPIDSNDFKTMILDMFEKLKEKLKSVIDYSPTEKNEEAKKLRQKISKLKIELKDVETDITSLEELKKE